MRVRYIVGIILILADISLLVISVFFNFLFVAVAISSGTMWIYACATCTDRKREPLPLDSPIDHSQLTLKEFLQAQPFVCTDCNQFTSTLQEFCENCGTKNSLRKTSKRDYLQYILKNEN